MLVGCRLRMMRSYTALLKAERGRNNKTVAWEGAIVHRLAKRKAGKRQQGQWLSEMMQPFVGLLGARGATVLRLRVAMAVPG